MCLRAHLIDLRLEKESVRAVLVARSTVRGSGNAHCSRTYNAEASRRICIDMLKANTPVLDFSDINISTRHLLLSHP